MEAIEAKRKAVRWAQQIIEQGRDVLIFDTETTGADPKKAEMVEIAVINGLGELVYQTLVRPKDPIPEDATAIHGITDEMVQHAPMAGPVLSSFHSMAMNRAALVSYNYAYDQQILDTAAIGHPEIGGTLKPRFRACAMKIWAHWNAEWDERFDHWRWVKLEDAAKVAGIEDPQTHRAYDDCVMTLGILWWLAQQSVAGQEEA